MSDNKDFNIRVNYIMCRILNLLIEETKRVYGIDHPAVDCYKEAGEPRYYEQVRDFTGVDISKFYKVYCPKGFWNIRKSSASSDDSVQYNIFTSIIPDSSEYPAIVITKHGCVFRPGGGTITAVMQEAIPKIEELCKSFNDDTPENKEASKSELSIKVNRIMSDCVKIIKDSFIEVFNECSIKADYFLYMPISMNIYDELGNTIDFAGIYKLIINSNKGPECYVIQKKRAKDEAVFHILWNDFNANFKYDLDQFPTIKITKDSVTYTAESLPHISLKWQDIALPKIKELCTSPAKISHGSTTDTISEEALEGSLKAMNDTLEAFNPKDLVVAPSSLGLFDPVTKDFDSIGVIIYNSFKEAIKDIITEFDVAPKHTPNLLQKKDEYMFAYETSYGEICAACSKVDEQYELWYRDTKGIKHVFMRISVRSNGWLETFDGDPAAVTNLSARIKKFVRDAVKEHNDLVDVSKEFKKIAADFNKEMDKKMNKMIAEAELHDVMFRYLKPRLIEHENDGGDWNNGSNAGLFYWSLYNDSSYSTAYIGSRIIIENDEIIGFNIYNTYSHLDEYVNIKIRKDRIEFIEDSKFVDFDKDFMKGLYNAIKSSMTTRITGGSAIEYPSSAVLRFNKEDFKMEVKKDRCACTCKPIQDQIKDVIFNDPATTVLWTDGTKTTVKRMTTKYQSVITKDGGKEVPVERVPFDAEAALAAAIMNKLFGNHSKYAKFVKGYVATSESRKAAKKKKVAKKETTKKKKDTPCTEEKIAVYRKKTSTKKKENK